MWRCCSVGLRGTGSRVAAMLLALGESVFDVTHRALVMGVLNRTPDSFYDAGRYFGFDAFLARAEAMVTAGVANCTAATCIRSPHSTSFWPWLSTT